MRKIRIVSVIFFLIAAASFVYFKIEDQRTADTNGPQIQMAEDTIEVSVEAGQEELLAGVTAEDDKDGDVSDSLVIESITNFKEDGSRTVTLAAFDSDNNVTKAAREVVYSDYTHPAFALSEPLYFPLNTESFLSSITASDSLDGNLTQNIKVSSEEDIWVNTEGEYPVVFSVSNSAGDEVQLPATVTLYDPSESQMIPVISLSQYLIYVKKGEAVDAWSYVDHVDYRGRIYQPGRDGEGREILTEDTEGSAGESVPGVEITNPVDTNIPGTYEIVYKVTADTGHGYETGTMRLIVVVNE